MAVTLTELTKGGAGTGGGASHATASVSPGSGKRLFLIFLNYSRGSSTNPVVPSSITGLGLTWAAFHPTINFFRPSGSTRSGGMVWYAIGTATSGTIMINHGWTLGTGDRCTWIVVEVTGADLRGDNGLNGLIPSTIATTSQTPNVAIYSTAVTSFSSMTDVSPDDNSNVHTRLLVCMESAVGNYAITGPGGSWSTLSDNTSSEGRMQAVTATGVGGTATFTVGTVNQAAVYEFEFIPLQRNVRFVGLAAATTRSTAGTLVLSWPTGYTPREGDLAIVSISGRTYSSTLGASGCSQTAGSTFTRKYQYTPGSGGYAHEIWYRELTGGDTVPTFDFTNTWMNYGNGDAGAFMVIYRGARKGVVGGPFGSDLQVVHSSGSTGIRTMTTLTFSPSENDSTVAIFQGNRAGSQYLSSAGTANNSVAQGFTYRYNYTSGSSGSGVGGGLWDRVLPDETQTLDDFSVYYGNTGGSSYWAVELLGDPEAIISSADVSPASFAITSTVTAEPAGPFIVPEITVGSIEVSTTINARPRRYKKPKRPLVWVHDYSGERVNVLD